MREPCRPRVPLRQHHPLLCLAAACPGYCFAAAIFAGMMMLIFKQFFFVVIIAMAADNNYQIGIQLSSSAWLYKYSRSSRPHRNQHQAHNPTATIILTCWRANSTPLASR